MLTVTRPVLRRQVDLEGGVDQVARPVLARLRRNERDGRVGPAAATASSVIVEVVAAGGKSEEEGEADARRHGARTVPEGAPRSSGAWVPSPRGAESAVV